jgi:hypothetical protein
LGEGLMHVEVAVLGEDTFGLLDHDAVVQRRFELFGQ